MTDESNDAVESISSDLERARFSTKYVLRMIGTALQSKKRLTVDEMIAATINLRLVDEVLSSLQVLPTEE